MQLGLAAIETRRTLVVFKVGKPSISRGLRRGDSLKDMSVSRACPASVKRESKREASTREGKRDDTAIAFSVAARKPRAELLDSRARAFTVSPILILVMKKILETIEYRRAYSFTSPRNDAHPSPPLSPAFGLKVSSL